MAERETIKTTGVCLGASSVGLVAVEWVPGPGADVSSNIVFSVARPHNGKVLQTIQALYGDGAPGTVHLAAVTGRRFRHALALPSISEPEAVEWAYGCVKEKYAPVDLIVAAGGETFMAYKLDGAGRVVSVYTGNKCASGSGEFFLQQIRRMGLSAEEALSFADLESPHLVAGRCSVFCKTDCTHALNKGAPKASVVSGLCAMMAGKIIDLIQKTRLADSRRVLLVGGAAANEAMLHFVRREFPQLQVAEEAPYFEALGAALWARDFGAPAPLSWEEAKLPARSAFTALPPLRQYAVQAASRNLFRGTGKAGDRCIIGLDVGSTTTKAVVLRMADNAVLAGTYLRTNGDPVGASRACYRALSDQLKTPVKIRGLGVTGSGRQIAGLHAGTDAVVNEIIAHARAAVHFDPEVDTIFEIGGQDAKYTYLTNGVASDYAMNEACSAGTGSFLEEAARESLDIDTHDIAGLAVLGRRPPNFNDQCAAFIASDIKQAIQEGIGREDICAGLVYSVCQNYNNRVKGARPVGRKVFMQGGVCYNHAVPLAMAALTGKDIIVPPEPGLMGAFGVALAVKDKLASGRLAEKDFDLSALADRVLSYGKPFTCTGGKENCDRKCEISRISIGDRLFPFGGACNRYVNLLHRTKVDTAALDLTAVRERLVFGDGAPVRSDGLRVGITASLLDHVLFPLFSTFFRELGFRVVLPDGPDTQGMERMGSAFCHPVEVAHGLLAALLKKKPDVIFLPHVMGMAVEKGIGNEVTCPLVQGEPYYLKSAFGELKNRRILSPMLNLSTGFEAAESSFVRLARSLGVSAKAGRLAFAAALETQRSVQSEMKDRGGKALEALAMDPQQFAVVLFGRPYNAFSKWANMGIPHKFASRGLPAIPFDFLPLEDEAPFGHMFWALGQINLKATRLVERHPQLFPVFITNFSCGPDSFILTYFRNLMGRKPSLTLELDSHTADAGVDTRIEAFLDVVASYIETERTAPPRSCNPARKVFAKVEKNGGMPLVRASNGTRLPLSHPNVRLYIPSMSPVRARMFTSAMRYAGIRADTLPPMTEADLSAGRARTLCKECLPYSLLVGSIFRQIESRKNGQVSVFFLPDSSGPCRLGQYATAMQALLEGEGVENAALLTLSSTNGYAGLGARFRSRAWIGLITGDILADIRNALLVLASDREQALARYEAAESSVAEALERFSFEEVCEVLEQAASQLAAIPTAGLLGEAPKVGLLGEIYVRLEPFATQYLEQRLADRGIMAKTEHASKFIYFCDLLQKRNLYHVRTGFAARQGVRLEGFFKHRFEERVKRILARSGLYDFAMSGVDEMCRRVEHVISPRFSGGETTLTVGAALCDVLEEVAGIVSVGPFGCMPSRVAEALLGARLNEEKPRVARHPDAVSSILAQHPDIPFFALECDGSPFPQLIEAKFEAFCMQVKRVHTAMLGRNKGGLIAE